MSQTKFAAFCSPSTFRLHEARSAGIMPPPAAAPSFDLNAFCGIARPSNDAAMDDAATVAPAAFPASSVNTSIYDPTSCLSSANVGCRWPQQPHNQAGMSTSQPAAQSAEAAGAPSSAAADGPAAATPACTTSNAPSSIAACRPSTVVATDSSCMHAASTYSSRQPADTSAVLRPAATNFGPVGRRADVRGLRCGPGYLKSLVMPTLLNGVKKRTVVSASATRRNCLASAVTRVSS